MFLPDGSEKSQDGSWLSPRPDLEPDEPIGTEPLSFPRRLQSLSAQEGWLDGTNQVQFFSSEIFRLNRQVSITSKTPPPTASAYLKLKTQSDIASVDRYPQFSSHWKLQSILDQTPAKHPLIVEWNRLSIHGSGSKRLRDRSDPRSEP